MMELTAYRAVLRRRLNIFRAAWCALLLLMLSRRFLGAEVADSAAYGLLLGGLSGGLVVAALQMNGMRKALKDDTVLRRLYNQEHDERMQAIRAKAGFPMTVILSLAMIAAALAAAFFSETVAMTLLAAALVQLLACLAVKAFYMRRM